jgi:hypothetical protein
MDARCLAEQYEWSDCRSIYFDLWSATAGAFTLTCGRRLTTDVPVNPKFPLTGRSSPVAVTGVPNEFAGADSAAAGQEAQPASMSCKGFSI